MQLSGPMEKMKTRLEQEVQYELPLGEVLVPMNRLIGTSIVLEYQQQIHCVACGRRTSKSFNQGFCFPCFRTLPQCDSCIIKPEQCHYHHGDCRDASWGEENCLTDHYVYLANSSGGKVGITRGTQIPTRWMDQGAVQALPIFRVRDRLTSGLVEVVMKAHVADKTSWQRMLKGVPEAVDLPARRDALFELCDDELQEVVQQQGDGAVEWLKDGEVVDIHYPVKQYPEKVKSLNFDKSARVEGVLLGIKGQYLILDSGVINIRKFGGYEVQLTTEL